MMLSEPEIRVLLLRFQQNHGLLETAQKLHLSISQVLALTDSALEKIAGMLVAL